MSCLKRKLAFVFACDKKTAQVFINFPFIKLTLIIHLIFYFSNFKPYQTCVKY